MYVTVFSVVSNIPMSMPWLILLCYGTLISKLGEAFRNRIITSVPMRVPEYDYCLGVIFVVQVVVDRWQCGRFKLVNITCIRLKPGITK